MNWQKLGQIFIFKNSGFDTEFISHTQSPQTVVFDAFVRIYFSTRKKSENGKFLSHVQYVDFDKTFKHIVNRSRHEVIKLGALGTFNEHGIFPFNPVKCDNKIYGFTTGWTRRVSVNVDSGIGLAVSNDDGVTFTKMGDGPVLTSSLHEPFLVCDGFVRIYDDVCHMWDYLQWARDASVQNPDLVKWLQTLPQESKSWGRTVRPVFDAEYLRWARQK